MYKILESKIVFQGNNIKEITVLIDCTSSNSNPLSDVRAIRCNNKPNAGYKWLMGIEKLDMQLLQSVAGSGFEVSDKDKIFPNWKSNLKL